MIPHPLRRSTDLDPDYQAQIHKDLSNTRRMFYVCIGVIGLAIASMMLFAYWKTAPYDVFELKQYKADVAPDPVVGNGLETMTVSFDYCKYSPLTAVVTRTLIGSRIEIALPVDHQRPLDTGCGRAERSFLIPKINNTGTYHIHYHVEYTVNPVRKVYVDYDTQDFEITSEGALDALP